MVSQNTDENTDQLNLKGNLWIILHKTLNIFIFKLLINFKKKLAEIYYIYLMIKLVKMNNISQSSSQIKKVFNLLVYIWLSPSYFIFQQEGNVEKQNIYNQQSQ